MLTDQTSRLAPWLHEQRRSLECLCATGLVTGKPCGGPAAVFEHLIKMTRASQL
jgi:hypothetical protein